MGFFNLMFGPLFENLDPQTKTTLREAFLDQRVTLETGENEEAVITVKSFKEGEIASKTTGG